ncbi:MAG: relaxase/mobilization nuclease domain-containing protein [Clostridia bacterium]|nr:relaxase/mobilization nuclease domain-containing protein [Clostridia bacterium]
MLKFSFYRCTKSPTSMISHVTKPGMSIYIDTQNLSAGEDYKTQFKKTMSDFYANGVEKNPEGVEYIHVMISNEKYDGQTAAQMHELALRFARTIFPYAQFIVATQPHETPDLYMYRNEAEADNSIHCHIIVCAADPKTHELVHVSHGDYHELKNTAEAIAKDYGLEPEEKKMGTFAEVQKTYEAEETKQSAGFSWVADLRRKISKAVNNATTLDEFYAVLKQDGIRVEPSLSFDDFVYFHPSRETPCRGIKLGRLYSKEYITFVLDQKNRR